ncbi:hypothetical protein FKW77_002824 [Venturia effusa]|uniref:CCHC-type domain-containing protein n=1 Tax=Venturia effusa TaxID=50376 RepID=A0A517LJU7_9PEZI|nr:hypothetical protein FKW77_002824 [Venturia effusa]
MKDNEWELVIRKPRGWGDRPAVKLDVEDHKETRTTIQPGRLIAKAGTSAPSLVGKAFRDMTSQDRKTNRKWRLAREKCIVCGQGNHFRNGCPLLPENIEKKKEAEEKRRVRLGKVAENKRAVIEMIMCTPPSDGSCPFTTIAQEILDKILMYAIRDLSGCCADSDEFLLEPHQPFQAPISQTSKTIRMQVLQIWLKMHTIILPTRTATCHFRRFCHRYNLFGYVRNLGFPSFYSSCLSMRHNTNHDVELMKLCPNLRKACITLQITRMEGNQRTAGTCHTITSFRTQYSLGEVCKCPQLKHVVLTLRKWHKDTVNVKPGGDVFGFGEDLAAWFRIKFQARVGAEALAKVKKLGGMTSKAEAAIIVAAAKREIVVETIHQDESPRD